MIPLRFSRKRGSSARITSWGRSTFVRYPAVRHVFGTIDTQHYSTPPTPGVPWVSVYLYPPRLLDRAGFYAAGVVDENFEAAVRVQRLLNLGRDPALGRRDVERSRIAAPAVCSESSRELALRAVVSCGMAGGAQRWECRVGIQWERNEEVEERFGEDGGRAVQAVGSKNIVTRGVSKVHGHCFANGSRYTYIVRLYPPSFSTNWVPFPPPNGFSVIIGCV